MVATMALGAGGPMKPKLHEVANISGVSLATVSRVMNGKPGVADATRRRVLDALSDLGYQDAPSQPARSGIVGIITPELENPIFSLLAQSIEARLARHDFMCVVCPATAETINEQDYLDHFLDTNAAGVVVINGRYANAGVGYDPYVRAIEQGLGVVLVNAIEYPCPVPSVNIDIAAGAHLAVRHLANLGHERIGCLVGPRRYVGARDFYRGWQEGMAEAGLDAGDERLSETLFTLEGGQAGGAKLLENEMTGIVAASDFLALGAIKAARDWGAAVPEDVSVVGFDGTPLAAFTDPSLSTLRQPLNRMAKAVAGLLTTFGNGEDRPAAQVFTPELVAGGSTARARALV